MLKYENIGIVFQEVPDEVTLAINITNCPCRCPGCHSPYLWQDTGTPLTEETLTQLLGKVSGDITCICFMGGDADPAEVSRLAAFLKSNYPQYKTGWYSGRTSISSLIDKSMFNYIKIGPYIRHLGPLNNPRTNQRMYKQNETGNFDDITYRFWKK